MYMFQSIYFFEDDCSHATDEGYVPPGFQDLQGSNLGKFRLKNPWCCFTEKNWKTCEKFNTT